MIYTMQQTMASSSSSATNGITKMRIRMLVMSLLFATGHIIRYVDGLDNKHDTSVPPTKKKILPNFTDEVKKAKLLTKKEDVEDDDETEDNDGSEVDEEDADEKFQKESKGDDHDSVRDIESCLRPRSNSNAMTKSPLRPPCKFKKNVYHIENYVAFDDRLSIHVTTL